MPIDGLQQSEDLVLLLPRLRRAASSTAGRPLRELDGGGSARLGLCERVPACGTGDAVDRVVERLRAAAILGRNAGPGFDQRTGNVCFVGCRGDAQRRVAGV